MIGELKLELKTLVLEMANSCKCHRDAVFIGCGDRFVILDRASGLYDRRYTKISGLVNVIADREECVRGQD